MTGLVRAELRQLGTTRATWGVLTAALLLVVALTALTLTGAGGIDAPPRGSTQLRDALVGASGMALVPVLLLGVLSVTGEFHHRTATSAFLVVPDRRRVLVAKAVACAVFAPLAAVAFMAVPYAVGVVSGAVDLTFDSRLLGLLGRALLVFACWALLGVGLGAALRNQTAALVVPVVWFGIVEQLAPSYPALRWLLPWLPGEVSTALAGGRFPGALPAWAALVVFLAYALALALAGARRIVRMDVT
jgi:ABC-2 type transport system permease protein